jgi:hypothetical protein
MRRPKSPDRICAYCAEKPGLENDHVLAKQLFPVAYRDNLPQVPSCGFCNRRKQKFEDSVGLFLQLGHDSDASRKVLDDRVPLTLHKNARLARALQRGMRWEWARDKTGLITHRLVVKINAEEQFHINQWFRLIAKGLYYEETKEPLPKDRKLYLVFPSSLDEFSYLKSFILNTTARQERTLARGEFYYLFAIGADKATTAWQFSFKSVDVFAFTTSAESAVLAEHDWNVKPPKTRDSGHTILLR